MRPSVEEDEDLANPFVFDVACQRCGDVFLNTELCCPTCAEENDSEPVEP